MALGEAFVNVRADLKPFAKDLEKGLKAILNAAERRVVAQGGVGNQLKDELKKKTGDGIEEGFTDGSRRGRKKGEKEFQSFFASLADFIDDGLSAIPAKVKAALLLGLIAAAIVISPLVAGVISAAILAGGATAAAALGAVFAFRLGPVKERFKDLGQTLQVALERPAQRFVGPLIQAAADIEQAFSEMGSDIDDIFSEGAAAIKPLVSGLLGFIKQAIPGFKELLKGARPVLEALAQSLPQLGFDLGRAFSIIAGGGPEAAMALRDFISALGSLIVFLAALIRGLTEAYYWLRVTSAAMSGDFGEATRLVAEHTYLAGQAAGDLADTLDTDLNPALSDTAAEARAADLAIAPLIAEMLKGQEAAIDLEQGMDDLRESIAKGNKDFDIRNQKGRENVRIVDSIITAAARQRDADIATALKNGESTDAIEANYQRQILALEKTISKTGGMTTALQVMFDKIKEAPVSLQIPVSAPGIEATTGLFGRLRKRIEEVAADFYKLLKANTGKSGSGSSHQLGTFAHGGIISSPTLGLMGEAGYDEAVIPDPAIMPARAMQLSDQIGLTQMISDSLGSKQQIVNVYIGSQRLQEMIDYTVAMNNQLTARSFAQGPRR